MTTLYDLTILTIIWEDENPKLQKISFQELVTKNVIKFNNLRSKQ